MCDPSIIYAPMRLPLELEHLVKESSGIDPTSIHNTPRILAAHLQAIEERKALEVEHYLQACILRLETRPAPQG